MYEIHKIYDLIDNSMFLPEVSIQKFREFLIFVYVTDDANDDTTANTYTDDNTCA